MKSVTKPKYYFYLCQNYKCKQLTVQATFRSCELSKNLGSSLGRLVGGCWSLSQLSLWETQGTPWTGRQTISGLTHKQPFTLTFTPTGNLESIINLTCMSLDCGRKPEYSQRTHANTRRTCKLHTERPAPIREPDLLAVRRQCSPLHHRATPKEYSHLLNRYSAD